jgi:hypothetical protein
MNETNTTLQSLVGQIGVILSDLAPPQQAFVYDPLAVQRYHVETLGAVSLVCAAFDSRAGQVQRPVERIHRLQHVTVARSDEQLLDVWLRLSGSST